MSYWSDLSKTNLLSLSQQQTDFQIALKEWKHTAGAVIDHLDSTERCQLCEQSNLRYHFEIANQITKNSLQIGSSCIEKFNIAVYDDGGNRLKGKGVLKQLKKEIGVRQQEMMLEPLRELWKGSNDNIQDIIERCVKQFGLYKGFSPENLLYLFKKMDAGDILYPSNIYKVLLRSNVDKEFLFDMPETDKNIIWASLSTSQKQRYAKGKKSHDKEKEKARKYQKMKENRHYDSFRSEIKEYKQNQPITHYQTPADPPYLSEQIRPTPIQPTQSASYLPDRPLRYVEKSHRFKITFLDHNNIPIDRLFRGGLEDHALL